MQILTLFVTTICSVLALRPVPPPTNCPIVKCAPPCGDKCPTDICITDKRIYFDENGCRKCQVGRCPPRNCRMPKCSNICKNCRLGETCVSGPVKVGKDGCPGCPELRCTNLNPTPNPEPCPLFPCKQPVCEKSCELEGGSCTIITEFNGKCPTCPIAVCNKPPPSPIDCPQIKCARASCDNVECGDNQTCAVVSGLVDSRNCPTCPAAKCVKQTPKVDFNPPIFGCETLVACDENPECPLGCSADACFVDKFPVDNDKRCYQCPIAKCSVQLPTPPPLPCPVYRCARATCEGVSCKEGSNCAIIHGVTDSRNCPTCDVAKCVPLESRPSKP